MREQSVDMSKFGRDFLTHQSVLDAKSSLEGNLGNWIEGTHSLRQCNIASKVTALPSSSGNLNIRNIKDY